MVNYHLVFHRVGSNPASSEFLIPVLFFKKNELFRRCSGGVQLTQSVSDHAVRVFFSLISLLHSVIIARNHAYLSLE